jgi:hypothetical protein
MSQPVYIVHTASDREMATRVAAHLEAQGIACLMNRDLDAENAPEVEWAIMLLMLSQSANDDDAILHHLRTAIAENKVLIPFRIESFRPSGEMQDHLRWRYVHEAFSPPLEKHLEELVRMIKPLLHGRSLRITEATSITRTLPSRAAILRKPMKSEAGAGSVLPLHAYLNFPHLIFAGHPTVVQCRLENYGVRPLTNIQPTLECRGFKKTAARTLEQLLPGSSELVEFDIEPGGFGQFNLRVRVQWREDETVYCASATQSVRIHEAPTIGDFPTILHQFSQETEATTATQSTRVEIPASITSPEELAQFQLPEDLERLDLAVDYAIQSISLERADAIRPLTIPREFLGGARAGTILQLTPVESAETDPYQTIRLVARPQFVLGRSGEESDFVLWFWPRNEVHDTKTRRISKKHITCSIEGRHILIHNTAAGSLTTYDGQDVDAAGVPLQRSGLLNLSGIYLLDVMHTPGLQNPVRITNVAECPGAATCAIPAVRGSVRFAPRTAGVLPQHSTWLLSDATFGSSPINPVALDLAGLADIQGRFHHAHGLFWLESFAENSAVQLNEQTLAPGMIAPLITGQILELGSGSYSVCVGN